MQTQEYRIHNVPNDVEEPKSMEEQEIINQLRKKVQEQELHINKLESSLSAAMQK